MAAAALNLKQSRSPVAALLTIGNELLTGRTINTNAAFLGSELTRLGFHVLFQQVCPDETAIIQKSLRQLTDVDLVIVTGGLGPTPDDVTREAIAEYFSVPLRFSSAQFQAMRRIYRKLGRKTPALARREAFYPANARPLVNRFGIALGFWVQSQSPMIVALPGVPTELEKMFTHNVRPLLQKRFGGLAADEVLVVRTVGISEPNIMEKLGKDFFDQPFQFGIYPSEGETQICIRSPSRKVITSLRLKIKKRLNGFVYAWEDESLAELTGKILIQRKKTLSVAESCTGGSLASAWTRYAGASRFFHGGATVYHARAKEKIGVPPDLIQKHGEVSAEVASELAVQACRFWETDFGIGVTGIAGPSGGSRKKPVGLVYIAVAQGSHTVASKHLFWGNRSQIQRKTVVKALEILWRTLGSKSL